MWGGRPTALLLRGDSLAKFTYGLYQSSKKAYEEHVMTTVIDVSHETIWSNQYARPADTMLSR
jgi:hypothetical protein